MKKIAQHIITLAVVAGVMLLVMGFAGDNGESNFWAFLAHKLLTLALLMLSLYAGKVLNDKGWLISDDNTNEDW